jgi:hypothetical protein
MGTLKEELERWKSSRYRKPMSVALAEVKERHDCSKVHPGKRHQEWIGEEMFDEGRMKDIYTMDQDGKSHKEIAQRLKLKVSTVKSILGEEVISEFSDAQIDSLKRDYAGLQGKTISGINANKLMKIFDKFDKSKPLLIKLLKAKIPFVSMLAQARLISKHGANAAQLAQMRREHLDEAKAPFRISYSKDGKHAGFEDGTSLQDIQNKAQKLRAKGFTIDKMGRNTSPVEQKLPEPEGKQIATEAYTVQITKSDGSKLVIGKYNTPAEAEKYISWYKTGNMSKTKSVKVIKEDSGYLQSKMNDKQIANIKNVWKNKKATDVTDAVRQMIKRMDIPTQLAIKHADIPHISKLVEIATHGHGPRLTFERLWLKHKRGDKAGK